MNAAHTRSLTRYSLRWRLPVFFCLIVAIVLVVFLSAMHRELDDALLQAGRIRAGEGAEEVSDLLSRAIEAGAAVDARRRVQPELIAFLRDQSARNRDTLRALLMPEQPFRRVEVWDAGGTLLMELATPRPDSMPGPRFLPPGAPPVAEGVSRIGRVGSTGTFDVVIAVRGGAGPQAPLLGYVRRFGTVTSPGGGIGRLLGSGAALRLGSPGGEWTDFTAIVGPPPLGDDGDAEWVGATAPVSGTPWTVWVGFPRAGIISSAHPFMGEMVQIGLALLITSGLLVTLFAVRLTRPLHRLADAAEEIAAGDYSRRVQPGAPDEIGRVGQAFNTMADRVQDAHGALQRSHDQIHFALTAARIGVWESHLGSGGMECSESMRTVLGLDDEPLPAAREAFLQRVHGDDRETVRGILQGEGVEDAVVEFRFRALAPGGSLRWIEGKARRRLNAEGRPVSVLGVSLDVTERGRLEAQLRQAQKMEAVGQLAGGIAHDFNNLLTAIVGNASLLLTALKDQPELHEDAVEILKAGESAAGLTRQLLAFSRRQVMQPVVVDVNAVVQNIEKLLRRLIGDNITLVTALDPALDAVRVDPGHLEQVLMNLVVNARDAMPGGGRVTITTANADFEDAADGPRGRQVMVAVTDTGCGMDAETLGHLFEPFFTTKQPGVGTGLGLATVFGIVNQSGGQIYVYSEPGHGASFKIYLPATTGSSVALPRSSASAGMHGGSETILVVEDSEPVRLIAKRILERIGYRVLEATTGEEALHLLAAGSRPDLVISDVIMPGMTGPELARRIAEADPTLRVLFTSGYSGDSIVRHGLEEPGTLFIEKPYSPGALASKVREALGAPAASG